MALRLLISSFKGEGIIVDYLGGPDIIAKVSRPERER